MTDKNTPQSLSELAGELAVPIARYMTAQDLDFPGAQQGSRLKHRFSEGTGEHAHGALRELGLLRDIPEGDPKGGYEFGLSTGYATVELAIAADCFPAHLKANTAISHDVFVYVLATFIDVFESFAASNYYKHSDFTSRRIPFSMPASLCRLSLGLERFGFVQRSKRGLEWIDKCSRAMWLAVSWGHAQNIEIASRTMPEKLREMIFPDRMCGLDTFQNAFLSEWNSVHWGDGYFADWNIGGCTSSANMIQVIFDIAEGCYGPELQLSYLNPDRSKPFSIFDWVGNEDVPKQLS